VTEVAASGQFLMAASGQIFFRVPLTVLARKRHCLLTGGPMPPSQVLALDLLFRGPALMSTWDRC
jgi:hypothetical protein